MKYAPVFVIKGTRFIMRIVVVIVCGDLQTTMIYTHVLKQGGQGVVSPFDCL